MALFESAMPSGSGFSVSSADVFRKDAWLFGEAHSRAIVYVRTEQAEAFERLLDAQKQAFERIGAIGGTDIYIDNENWGQISDWKHTFDNRLADIMN